MEGSFSRLTRVAPNVRAPRDFLLQPQWSWHAQVFSRPQSPGERSGLSLHAIRRATWGAPETGACVQPARSLPRSQRGRETPLLHHRPGTKVGSRAEPLPCPASASQHSHTPPRPHTRWTRWRACTHLSPLGNQTRNGLVQGCFPWGSWPLGPRQTSTPSRPRAGGEGGQGPVVKVHRATSAKSPGLRSDSATGSGSWASEEGPYYCRSPTPSWNRSAEQKPSFSHKLRSNIRPCEKLLLLEQCLPSVTRCIWIAWPSRKILIQQAWDGIQEPTCLTSSFLVNITRNKAWEQWHTPICFSYPRSG